MKKKQVLIKMDKPGIKKNDIVVMLLGKDKSKQGKVLEVNYKTHKVTVEGINMSKKAVRPSQQNPKGGIIEMALPVHISNIRLLCPKCNKPTRISRKEVNQKKVRVCRKCNEIVDKV